ncbi:MAG: hypothetical protein HC809_13235 [Gammaproteobacteria bacterium]|nr:hypothetical protein [Gammaproteobacteria bacterium]
MISPAALLTVCVDFKHPAAYLALAPTLALANRLNLAIDWVPKRIPLPRGPSEPAGEDRGSQHRRLRHEYVLRDLRRYGPQGIDRPPAGDSTLPALGLLRVRRDCPARLSQFVAAMFDAIWAKREAMNDAHLIAGLVAAAGADGGGLAEAADDLDAIEAALTERGIFNVPAYIVDDEVFFGRAHLPMVEWIIRGREGQGPI